MTDHDKNKCLLMSYLVEFGWFVIWSITLCIPLLIRLNNGPLNNKYMCIWFFACFLIMIIYGFMIGYEEYNDDVGTNPDYLYPAWQIGQILRNGGHFGKVNGVSNVAIYDGRRGVKFGDHWDKQKKWFF